MNAEKEVRIIVKNNDQVGKIIKWYQDNKQMLDAEKFVIPFQSGSIILPGEIVSFEAKQYGLIELCLQIKNGKKVLMWENKKRVLLYHRNSVHRTMLFFAL